MIHQRRFYKSSLNPMKSVKSRFQGSFEFFQDDGEFPRENIFSFFVMEGKFLMINIRNQWKL